MIDHIYLPVSDLKRSSEFYKKVLEPLGIDMPDKGDQPPMRGFAINNIPGFWLKHGEVAKDLYVAFTAKSADAVRASYKAARDAEATSNKEPSLRPEWHADYFAANIATRTDTTSRLPISLGSTNKRYEPSRHQTSGQCCGGWSNARI
jgi:catechol 2,3-dioxygenase-like lactoylglutathione lyase family enzyme